MLTRSLSYRSVLAPVPAGVIFTVETYADRLFCASQTAEPSVVGLLREAKRQHTEHYEARRKEEEAAVALSGQGGSGGASVDEAAAPSTAVSPEAAEASPKDGGGKEGEKDEDGEKGLSESLLLRV